MQLYCVRSYFSKWQPFEIECISIASGHAFQNARHLNAALLHQVMLFKMPVILKHLYCARSRFSKCQLFECSSIVSGHAFKNGSHLKLNAALLHQVMLFKMPTI
jgi:hypothetical protein